VANDCVLITLAGEFDMTRVAELQSSVEGFADSPAVHVVVDLSDVTFLGSEGIAFVARLCRLARGREGTVTLINATRTVVRALEICGLTDMVQQERHYSSNHGTGIPTQRPASRSVADLISS
jgi:anti-sigma B factor antagonist